MAEYYHLSVQESIAAAGSSKDGLSNREAEARLARYGLNELRKEKKSAVLRILLDQFKNFLILMLIFAVVLAFFLGESVDAIAMMCIIILTIALGFVQEYRAERAIEALERISAPTARVIRDGIEIKMPAANLVPGDMIVLEEGDIVPADARVIELSELNVDEASLTGESMPSKKTTRQFPENTVLSDQDNMVFLGTIVTYGKGKAIVVSTGMSTQMGLIATTISETEETQTPLQKKFEHMSKQLGMSVLGLVFIVFIFGILKTGTSVENMFFFALSLAVAAVPSALAAIVTISLALGARVLASKNMIVKKLPAAESLGAVTIICSDKTGTLTKNQMTVTKMYAPFLDAGDAKREVRKDGSSGLGGFVASAVLESNPGVIDVSGSGYEPRGEFFRLGKRLTPAESKLLELPLRIGILCNNSKVHSSDKGWEVIGDPTEGSLVVLAKKANLHEERLLEEHEFVHELPFDSNRKAMSVIFDERESGNRYAYVKGAPDQLLQKCDRILTRGGKIIPMSLKEKKRIIEMNDAFAENALRVLGMAYKQIPLKNAKNAKKRVDARNAKDSKDKDESPYTIENIECSLVFVGLVGMFDPPREEVKDAVAKCKEAGIKVMVITGDQAITAEAVARLIGLYEEGDLVLTGAELSQLSDEALFEKIDSLRIIARALPIQKSRIVDMLQKKGHTVAMTGDGVNDAPALKKADVGIAMGITGTDVAKEVSKSILVDDNFASIVTAVAEGRNIYDKILKSTRYLLSCNMGEITSVFVAIVLNFPLPMLPLQILLMNLVTDGIPAMGLGMESADDDVMKRPPRSPKEHPLSGRTFMTILLFGLIMGIGSIYLFSQYCAGGVCEGAQLAHARTLAFTSLVMFEMFATLNNRSLQPFKKLNLFTNKWLTLGVATSILIQLLVIYAAPLQMVFGTVALTLSDWIWILGTSFVGFMIMELSKAIFAPRRTAFVAEKQIKSVS